LDRLTSYSSCAATAAVVVYDQGVTFYNAIHSKIASIPGVRDLSVLETFDGDFNRVDCRSSCF
jgi:hypothetical protein